MNKAPDPVAILCGFFVIALCAVGVSRLWDSIEEPAVRKVERTVNRHYDKVIAMHLDVQGMRAELKALKQQANDTSKFCEELSDSNLQLYEYVSRISTSVNTSLAWAKTTATAFNDWVDTLQGRVNGFREGLMVTRWQARAMQEFVKMPQEERWIPDPLPSPWGDSLPEPGDEWDPDIQSVDDAIKARAKMKEEKQQMALENDGRAKSLKKHDI